MRAQSTSLAAAGRLMRIAEELPPEMESTHRSQESELDVEDVGLSLPSRSFEQSPEARI